ncbi:MAG: energy transducer TonB [Candidatus Methylomirabilales bacterium]
MRPFILPRSIHSGGLTPPDSISERPTQSSALPRDASAQTPSEKPVVYNHITQAGAALDPLVHQTYDAEFKVLDFSDRDGVHVPPQLKRGFVAKAPVDDKGVPIEGRMVVFFIVSTEGRIVHPVIVGSAVPRLNLGVLEALAQWELEPARINGRDVSTTAGEEFDIKTAK